MLLTTSPWAITAAVIVGLVSLLWLYGKRKSSKFRTQFAEQNLKFVSVPNFFLSVFKGETPGLAMDRVVQKEGKVFGFEMFVKKTILVADPELIQQVLSKEFTTFTNRRPFKTYDEVFKHALSVVEGEQWKRLRSIITPTFSSGKLKRMKPRIDDALRTLVKNIDQKLAENPTSESILNIKPLYGAYTMDTIIQVAFGLKIDSINDEENELIRMAKKLFQKNLSFWMILKGMVIFMLPSISKRLNLRFNADVTDYFTEFSLKIINDKREEFRKDSENHKKADSFIELLLEAEYENERMMEKEKENDSNNGTEEINGKSSSKFMTNQEMIAQCVVFFLAGYETTSMAITMTTFMLATHPEAQAKLHQEIDAQLSRLRSENSENEEFNPDITKLVNFESLNRFEYLNAVLSETLRLHAPAPFVERTAAADIRLNSADCGEILIKKDDVVHVPVYSVHHDREQFPEPDVFKPERFLGTELEFHRYAYIPFGGGPRNCVARSLALLEAKLALLHVFARYRMTICEETKIPMQFFNQGSFITPKDCVLRLERRDDVTN